MIFWRMKCDFLFVMNSDLLYIIYMLGKRGVTELMINMHEIWWIVWKWKIYELWRKIDRLWEMMIYGMLICKWLLATI